MRFTFAAAPALAVLLGLSGVPAMQAAPVSGTGMGYAQDRWDAPPRAYNQYQRQGFMDGMEGARKDVENHRNPDVNNRDEYRHPSVPGQFREAYREGFRQGYDRAMQHYMGGGPAYVPQGQGLYGGRDPWNAPPRAYNQYQRSGFMDGMEGARKDVENHRNPDVENRDEYRHPNVPGQFREAYREGFRQGYDRAMQHYMGGGPAYVPQGPAYQPQGPAYGRDRDDWRTPPSEFNEVQRQGFRDGIEGAHKDFGNNRAPNVNNRDEYRHPIFRGPDRRVYREAFRRGYRMAASRLWGPGNYR